MLPLPSVAANMNVAGEYPVTTLLPLIVKLSPSSRICTLALVLTNAGALVSASEGITNTPVWPLVCATGVAMYGIQNALPVPPEELELLLEEELLEEELLEDELEVEEPLELPDDEEVLELELPPPQAASAQVVMTIKAARMAFMAISPRQVGDAVKCKTGRIVSRAVSINLQNTSGNDQ